MPAQSPNQPSAIACRRGFLIAHWRAFAEYCDRVRLGVRERKSLPQDAVDGSGGRATVVSSNFNLVTIPGL